MSRSFVSFAVPFVIAPHGAGPPCIRAIDHVEVPRTAADLIAPPFRAADISKCKACPATGKASGYQCAAPPAPR